MVEITYKQIVEFPVLDALQVLVGTTMPAQTAYEVGKLSYHIQKAEKDMRAGYQTMVQKFVPEWTSATMKNPEVPKEKQEDFKAAEEAFWSEVHKIDRHKVPLAVVNKLQMTPAHMLALEPLLADAVEDVL